MAVTMETELHATEGTELSTEDMEENRNPGRVVYTGESWRWLAGRAAWRSAHASGQRTANMANAESRHSIMWRRPFKLLSFSEGNKACLGNRIGRLEAQMCSSGKQSQHKTALGMVRFLEHALWIRIPVLVSSLSPRLCFLMAVQSCGCWGSHPHGLNHSRNYSRNEGFKLKNYETGSPLFWEGGLLPGTHYVAQVVLKLAAILLPLSHKWIIGMSHHACLVISIQAALSFFRIESREEQGRA